MLGLSLANDGSAKQAVIIATVKAIVMVRSSPRFFHFIFRFFPIDASSQQDLSSAQIAGGKSKFVKRSAKRPKTIVQAFANIEFIVQGLLSDG
jgi:hypothetical protein